MHNKPKPSDTGAAEDVSAAMRQPGKSLFRVKAHLEVPVSSELVLAAVSPEEAMEMAQTILKGDSIAGHFHNLIDARTVGVPIQRNEQVDVRLESVLLDVAVGVFVWEIVDLGSGDSYGPVFKILPNEPSTVKPEDGSTTAGPAELAS